jgi:hypothetical protein
MDPKKYNREIEAEIAGVKRELESEKISSGNNGASIEIVFRNADSEARCVINPRIVLYENSVAGKRYVRSSSSSQILYDRVRILLQELTHHLVFDPPSIRAVYVKNFLKKVGGEVREILSGRVGRGEIDKLVCGGKTVVRSVKITKELDRALRATARRLGMKDSELIRLAIVATIETLAEGGSETPAEGDAPADSPAVTGRLKKTFVEVGGTEPD